MFKIFNRQGFHIVFDSGITLSTQFGEYNYCGKYPQAKEKIKDGSRFSAISKDCEIGVWDKRNKWITKEMYEDIFGEELGDDVLGFVSLDNWLKILDWCRNHKDEEP
jgi:hypothetical protein